MRRSFRTRGFCAGEIPRVCTLGWYAMPPQGMGSDTWLAGPVSGTRWGSGIGHVVGAHGIGNALDDPLTNTRWRVRYREHGGPTVSKLLSSNMP